MDMISLVPKNLKSIVVACSTSTSNFFELLKEKVTAAVSGVVDKAKIFIGQLTPVVGAHVGPGCLGVGYITND